MRVVHMIGGGDTGGAKTHVLGLLKELQKQVDAELVCFRRGEFSEDAEKLGIKVHIIDTGNPVTDLPRLKKLLRPGEVDVLHCHGARGNLMGTLMKGYLKVPVITTVHSDYKLDYLGRPAARLVYGTTNTICLRRVDYYICVAGPVTEAMIERNFPAERIYTIYNGIDFNAPKNCVPRAEFLKGLGLDYKEGDVVVGIAARLTAIKDHSTLLRAMQLAAKECPNLKLVCAGDGEDERKLRDLARSLGIEDRVCFAGWVKDMDSFYNALDMNLLSSLSEGFPYALAEGTRFALPTLSTRVGGVPVLVDHEENGYLFEPGDFKALAGYLTRLAKDPALRRELGDKLCEKSKREFSLDHMVEYQLEIYEDVLRRHARRKSRGRRDGAIICGAYGHGNAGDDAILKSVIGAVQGLDKDMPITVLAKNTGSIKGRYRVNAIYSFHFWKMLWAMGKSKLYINGGGTLIQNVTSQRSLLYYLFTLWAAKRLGNKVDMYGCGIGPVTGKGSVWLVRHVLNSSVDTITLREGDSVKELEKFGVTRPEIHLCSDPALELPSAPEAQALRYLSAHGLPPEGKYVCFMLRGWQGFDEKAGAFAACARFAYEKLGLTPVFLSLNRLPDTHAAQKACGGLACPYHILDDLDRPELIIAVLGYMRLVVSMRLHGLIFSSLSGIPMVGVSYDPKIGSFLRYLGYGQCMELSDVTAESLSRALTEEYKHEPGEPELLACTQRLIDVQKGNAEALRRLLHL